MDSSAIDAIEKLGSLLERGLITRAEFDEQKRVLLSVESPALESVTADNSSSVEPNQVPFFPMTLDSQGGWNGYINRSIEWLLPQLVNSAEAQEFTPSLELITDQLGNPAVSVFCSGKIFKHGGVDVVVVFSYIDDFATQVQVDAQGGDAFGRQMTKWVQRIFETFNEFITQKEREDAIAGNIQNPRRFFQNQSYYWNLHPHASSNDYSTQLRMSIGDGQMLNTPHAICAVQAFSCTGTGVNLEPVTSA